MDLIQMTANRRDSELDKTGAGGGVTSLLPTTVTQMPDVLTAALKNVAEVMEEGYEGS